MTGASLCSGYGGLDLVARKLFGGDVAVHGETYEPACRVLDAHWPGVPNVGDITTADWSPWAGRIGWLTAGWPCQPWSTAGKRLGAEDDRAIWPAVARAIRDLGPRVVLLENVAAIAPLGELGRTLGDLADLGFDAEWRCVRASDAGASHQRRRIFILAVARDTDSGGRGRWPHESRWVPGDRAVVDRDVAHTAGQGRGHHEPQHVGHDGGEEVRAGQTQPGRCGGAAANAPSDGRHEGRPEPAGQQRRPDAALGGGPAPADPCGAGLEIDGIEPAREELTSAERGGGADVEWGGYEPAIRRWEQILARPAPAPVVMGRRGGHQLSPAFVEWLMGLPAGWVTDVPGLSRNEQLHLLGNGVVPQQAALAFSSMLPEFAQEAA